MKKLVSLVLVLVLSLCVALPSLAEAYGGIEGTIYWIGKMYEGDGWMAITDGAKLAAKEMNLDVNFTYPEGGELDLAGQIALVENAINAGAAAIVLAPNDSDALVPVCEQAVEANIPLFVYDTALSDSSLQKAFVSYSFYTQGVYAAEALKEKFGDEECNVAVINATAGNQAHMDRENGFLDTIATYENFHLLGDVLYCNNDSIVAMNQAIDLASTYPELNAIYAANSMCIEGVAPGVASLTDRDITVVACDTSDAIVQAIKDGTLLYTSACNASSIGYLSIVVAAKYLAGEELGDIEWNNRVFEMDPDTMTIDSGVTGIDAEVVADPSKEWVYRPLSWFDSYEGWNWFA